MCGTTSMLALPTPLWHRAHQEGLLFFSDDNTRCYHNHHALCVTANACVRKQAIDEWDLVQNWRTGFRSGFA